MKMIKTPYQKNIEAKGTLMGKAAIAGGWTPELKEEMDYLDACSSELLAPSGTYTGKPNPKREQELGDLMEAGVYRSLHRLETQGTEEDRIFEQMRANISAAKAPEYRPILHAEIINAPPSLEYQLRDPVMRNAFDLLLTIGQKYLGLTRAEQLKSAGIDDKSELYAALHKSTGAAA